MNKVLAKNASLIKLRRGSIEKGIIKMNNSQKMLTNGM
jgi:hypothetical protein